MRMSSTSTQFSFFNLPEKGVGEELTHRLQVGVYLAGPDFKFYPCLPVPFVNQTTVSEHLMLKGGWGRVEDDYVHPSAEERL